MNHIPMERPVPASSHGEAALLDASAFGAGVSWSAIIAGATAAASLSLILLILGVGLGFSAVSPWSGEGVSAASFGVATIGWLTFTQLAASAMGGFLAGRLRSRWASLHTDEVYFRDTAHGFLSWGLATLVSAAVLTSAVGTVVSAGAKAGGAVAATTAAAAAAPVVASASGASGDSSTLGGVGYYVDAIFRKEMGVGGSNAAPASLPVTGAPGVSVAGTPPASSNMTVPPTAAAEVGRIFVSAIAAGALPSDDLHYVGQLVALHTGLSQADAQKRVSDSFNRLQAKTKALQTQAKEAADKARTTAAYAALWFFVSLLAGAFVASLAATFGGRRRDLF